MGRSGSDGHARGWPPECSSKRQRRAGTRSGASATATRGGGAPRELNSARRYDSFSPLSLSALLMTDNELMVIATLAQTGLISRPTKGYRMPAATGTPTRL